MIKILAFSPLVYANQIPASQLSVQLHCCTPGDLGPAQGSTGIYRGSHLLVAGAMRQALLESADSNTTNVDDSYALPWSALEAALKNASELYAANHPLEATNNKSSTVAAGSASASSKARRFGFSKSSSNDSGSEESRPLAGLLEQPHLKSSSVLLMHGATVHGTMQCAKSMPAAATSTSAPSSTRTSTRASSPTGSLDERGPSIGSTNTLPRVIMNAKVPP
jgi:hypothetical protein